MLLAIIFLCAVCIQVRYKREFAARQETNEELYNEQAALECHLSTEVTATALQACCGDALLCMVSAGTWQPGSFDVHWDET